MTETSTESETVDEAARLDAKAKATMRAIRNGALTLLFTAAAGICGVGGAIPLAASGRIIPACLTATFGLASAAYSAFHVGALCFGLGMLDRQVKKTVATLEGIRELPEQSQRAGL